MRQCRRTQTADLYTVVSDDREGIRNIYTVRVQQFHRIQRDQIGRKQAVCLWILPQQTLDLHLVGLPVELLLQTGVDAVDARFPQHRLAGTITADRWRFDVHITANVQHTAASTPNQLLRRQSAALFMIGAYRRDTFSQFQIKCNDWKIKTLI